MLFESMIRNVLEVRFGSRTFLVIVITHDIEPDQLLYVSFHFATRLSELRVE